MTFDSSVIYIVFIACGLGLVAVGATPILLPRRHRAFRPVIWLAAAVLALGTAAIASYSAGGAVALAIAAVASAIAVAQSRVAARVAGAALLVLKSAGLRWGAVAA